MDPHEAEPPIQERAPAPDLPSLPARLVSAFVSPGRLMEGLAAEPKWVGATLLGAAMVALSIAVIPTELILEAQRQAVLERGADMPEIPDSMMSVIRVTSVVMPAIFWLVANFAIAGLYALVFVFVLGDEGRYKQYLAALSHAWFIAAVFGLLLAPLRISQGDLEFRLSVGSFFFFLPEGFLRNFLQALDLSHIWSTLVFAQGAHAIHEARSVTSAAVVGFIVLLPVVVLTALLA